MYTGTAVNNGIKKIQIFQYVLNSGLDPDPDLDRHQNWKWDSDPDPDRHQNEGWGSGKGKGVGSLKKYTVVAHSS